jgi:hypothetical protein
VKKMLDLDPIKARLAESRKSRSSMFAASDALAGDAPWVGIRDDLSDLVTEIEHMRKEVERLQDRQGYYSHIYLAAVEVIRFAWRLIHDGKPRTAKSMLMMALGSHAGEEPWDYLLEMIREQKSDAPDAYAQIVANAPTERAALIAQTLRLQGVLQSLVSAYLHGEAEDVDVALREAEKELTNA